jgi:hypothetical protein
MTAPLIERVARAICAAKGIDPDKAFDPDVEGASMYWTICIPEARASIAIQRELIQQLRDALEEAQADVTSELQRCELLAGYPSTDRRLKFQRDLERQCTEAIAAADAALKDTP